jgi:hypothetical protein
MLGTIAVLSGLVLIGAGWIWFVRPPADLATETYTGMPPRPVALPAPSDTGARREPVLPDGFVPVAADSYLRLYLHEQALHLAVADLRTGYVWYSTPPDAGRAQANPLFKDLLNSIVRIKFMVGTRNAPEITGAAAAQKSVSRIDGGVAFSLHYEKPGIGFDVEVTLRDGGLEVAIPWASVRELASGRGSIEGDQKDAGRLMAVSVLPFFGAAPNGSEGYLVVPDGSGSLIYFRPRPLAELIWQEPVYGQDPTFKIDHRMGRFQPVHLPLFGIVRDGHAVAAFMTEGDADAVAEAAADGQGVPYNRALSEFLFRKSFRVSYSRSRNAVVPENDLIPGERRQRYVFLAGPQANYVGIGQAYADYLAAVRGAAAAGAPEPVMVRLFGGVNRTGALWDRYVPMTPYADAQRMLRDLRQAGAADLLVVYQAWQQEGYLGELPDRFPPDRRLGGDRGLREFLAWARAEGIPVLLEDDYLNAYDISARGFTARTETVRNAQGLVLPVLRHNLAIGRVVSRPWYLVNPLVALDRQVRPALAQFREWGAAGVELAHAGETLVSSYRTNPLTRSGHAAVWQQALVEGRQALGRAGARGAGAYLLGGVDYIWGVPLDHSHHWLLDEAVPLYQVVLRQLAPYYAPPTNLRDDPRFDFLRMIEYGAFPSFLLTAENPAELRYSVLKELFTGRYEDWSADVLREYQVARDVLLPLAGQQIVAHGPIVPKVYRTVYADGTAIVVNYGRVHHDVDGVRVQPGGFAVIRGG